jgi:hypothetical protein
MQHKALLASPHRDWSTRSSASSVRTQNSRGGKSSSFKRHCGTAGAHPFNVLFCDNCRNFFARSDSLDRHREKPPAEVHAFTPERRKEANEKRGETPKSHDEFMERLKGFVATGEDIGTPFCEIIKEMYHVSRFLEEAH